MSEIAKRLGELDGKFARLEERQSLNHSQNRSDIHDIRNILQKVSDKISSLEIKNARWSLAAGVITALTAMLIEHLVK